MTKPDSYSKFEDIICTYWAEKGEDNASRAFWDEYGMPVPEYGLLDRIVQKAISDGDIERAQSGALAAGLDIWISGELRAAGFEDEQPWPRLHQPRVLDPAISKMLSEVPASKVADLSALIARSGSTYANVQGDAYEKQVDVGMSSWLTGPEILISTKTMTGSYGKNLKNRFEEAYGDAENLRKRYPLASIGFFFMLNVDITNNMSEFAKAVTMLGKLQGDKGAYDASALMLADLSGTGPVFSPQNDLVPEALSIPRFFERIVDMALVRGPMSAHAKARKKAPLENLLI